MEDFSELFFAALRAGEGWAVAVAFTAGIIGFWLINRAIELYRHVRQWFMPIMAPAPQPMVPTPSGCARFAGCVRAGFVLVAIVVGSLLFVVWLVLGIF